jgi:hypothetical protein
MVRFIRGFESVKISKTLIAQLLKLLGVQLAIIESQLQPSSITGSLCTECEDCFGLSEMKKDGGKNCSGFE